MKNLQWEFVDSSNIKAISYNENNEKLYLSFHSGGIYEYDNVPQPEYEGLIYADSIGSYFYKNIRGVYNYRKIG